MLLYLCNTNCMLNRDFMKKKIRNPLQLIVAVLFISASALHGQGVIDLETGIAGTGYNNVRIPGDQGTLFSLKNDLKASPAFFYRLRLSYTIKSRHTLSLLYAPLSTKSTGSVVNDILFEGVNFPANTDLTGTYKFNSYRFTYRYEIVRKPGFEFGLGLTAKIRDASIALKSQGLTSEKTNLGFVPLINFRMLWMINENLGFLVDGDALAAKQGRAEDVLIAATYNISHHIGLKAGYRLLEGGADNDEVYNFALFNYGSLGCFIRF
jgi:hypothetical protein